MILEHIPRFLGELVDILPLNRQNGFNFALFLALSLILSLVGTRLITGLQSTPGPPGTGREPPVAPYYIPNIGHLPAFLSNPGKLLRSLRKRFPDNVFSIVLNGIKFHVVCDPTSTSAIFSKSRDYLFDPILASMMENGIGLPPADTKFFHSTKHDVFGVHGTHLRQTGSKDFTERNHDLFTTYLSGEFLNSSMKVYEREVSTAMKKFLPYNSEIHWTTASLHDTILNIVIQASAATYFGRRALEMYPTLCEDCKVLDDALYIGVRSNLAFLRPQSSTARERITNVFKLWVSRDLGSWLDDKEVWSEDWGTRLSWERENLLREYNFSIKGRACSHWSILWASYTNTAPLTTWLLVCTIGDRDTLKQFRKEIVESLLPPSWSHPEELEFDVKKLRSSTFIQALWRETLRTYSTNSTARIVTKDMEIEGYVVKKGSVVLIPARLLHFDERIFENPDKFDIERWLEKPSDIDNSIKVGRPSPDAKGRKQRAALRPFGGGNSVCSGRFAAEVESLLTVAKMVLQFDWELPTSTSKPTPEPNPRSLGIMAPAWEPLVKLRRRQNPRTPF